MERKTDKGDEGVERMLERLGSWMESTVHYPNDMTTDSTFASYYVQIQLNKRQIELIEEQRRISAIQEKAATSMKRATWVIAGMSFLTFLIALLGYLKPAEAPVVIRQLPQEAQTFSLSKPSQTIQPALPIPDSLKKP